MRLSHKSKNTRTWNAEAKWELWEFRCGCLYEGDTPKSTSLTSAADAVDPGHLSLTVTSDHPAVLVPPGVISFWYIPPPPTDPATLLHFVWVCIFFVPLGRLGKMRVTKTFFFLIYFIWAGGGGY